MSQQRGSRIALACLTLACILAAAFLGGCTGAPTPTPQPTIMPAPTPTPALLQALDGHIYLIQVDGALYGVEEIHAEITDQGLVVLSEIQRAGIPDIERRTAVLSTALNPLQYTVERVVARGRSYWLAVRSEDGLACLSSNLDWYGPVFHPQLSPPPDVMLEGAPTALPYVLMALRFANLGLDPLEAVLRLQTMDVLQDLPESQPLDLAGAPEEESAIIGTVALRGSHPEDEPLFTLWFEPTHRVLYNVTIPSVRWDIWATRQHPELAGEHDVTIRRVRQTPELPPTPTLPGTRRQEVMIPISDGHELAGTLILPAGQGPFPCVVLPPVGGSHTRWEPGDALAERGWAALSYDPRGLGQSGGRHAPGELATLAKDARAVGAWAAADGRIAEDAVYIAGVGEGAYVAATLLADEPQPYAGAIVAPYTPTGNLAEIARCQVTRALAPYHGWDRASQDRYLTASLGNWQAWLLEGESEIALLGRRLPLRGLQQWSQADMGLLLAAAQRPLLYVHLQGSPWICPDDPLTLSSPVATVTAMAVDLLSQPSPLPEEVADAWVDWANKVRNAS